MTTQLIGCGPRNYLNENDELRAERLDLEATIDELEERLAVREGELAAIRAQVQDNAQPIEGVEPPRLAGIVLGKLTGPIDTDGDQRLDGLRVYLRPIDQHSRQITAAGTAELRVVSLPNAEHPTGRPLLAKSYDPEALHQAYRSGFTGTHYTLAEAFPEAWLEAPPAAEAMLFVTLTDAATGRTYSAQQPIALVRREAATP